MFQFYSADLHLHTALSPCAERSMTPDVIIARAQELRLDILAVTDHNSAENAGAVIEAAEGTEITVLPGMEVQTREEAHILCLFDRLAQALAWQEIVYTHLPNLKNKEEAFGPQWVVDATGEILAVNDRLLLVAADLSVEQVIGQVKALGGLCIPSHVDRPAYSIISQLGFIPPDLELLGVEISRLTNPAAARQRFPQLKGLGIVANSDAHDPAGMMARNTFKIVSPTTDELALALAHREGRELWVDGIQL
jgi:hypothetical protein